MMTCLSLELANVLNGMSLKDNQTRAMLHPRGEMQEQKWLERRSERGMQGFPTSWGVQ